MTTTITVSSEKVRDAVSITIKAITVKREHAKEKRIADAMQARPRKWYQIKGSPARTREQAIKWLGAQYEPPENYVVRTVRNTRLRMLEEIAAMTNHADRIQLDAYAVHAIWGEIF